MTVIAGVDVGNATTEVVLLAGQEILGGGRMPTRGRKGSAESVRGAAALVRRVERQAGCTVTEARIAPLRAVDTSVVTVPDAAPPSGRLRVLAAGVSTPGGTGTCVGPPLLLTAAGPPSGLPPQAAGRSPRPAGLPQVAVVPAGMRYDQAAARLRDLLAAGTAVGAVLVAGDEGVLVANRLPADLPVIDQVDAEAAAACQLLAVEVRPPGHALNLLTDPVALGARFGLGEAEAGDAVTVSRALADHSNAAAGLLPEIAGPAEASRSHGSGRRMAAGSRCEPPARRSSAGRSARSGRSALARARGRWMTCSPWTWPLRPKRLPPGRAAPAGPCWSPPSAAARGSRPSHLPNCSASCWPFRCASRSLSRPRPGWAR